MIKRMIHWAAAGSVGLTIGGAAFAGDVGRPDHTSPACHPTYGYHQTCWRRFPALPPYKTCDTCDQGMAQSLRTGGNCQVPPLQQPQAQPMGMQPSPMPVHGGHSMYNGAAPIPAPLADPAFQSMPPAVPPADAAPVPLPQSASTTGRSQSHMASPVLVRPPATQSNVSAQFAQPPIHMYPETTRPVPVPDTAPAANDHNLGLPPIPSVTSRSSGLSIPALSRVLPGSGRHRTVSGASNRLPVRTASGDSIINEAHRRNISGDFAAQDGSGRPMGDFFSTTVLLQFVPLLIIALGYGAWSRERGALP